MEVDPGVGGSPREEIRAELEATRQAHHALLGSHSEEDWRKASGNPAWTVGQLMVHMTFAPRMLPADVKMIRRGGWMPNLPACLLYTSDAADDTSEVLVSVVGG